MISSGSKGSALSVVSSSSLSSLKKLSHVGENGGRGRPMINQDGEDIIDVGDWLLLGGGVEFVFFCQIIVDVLA